MINSHALYRLSYRGLLLFFEDSYLQNFILNKNKPDFVDRRKVTLETLRVSRCVCYANLRLTLKFPSQINLLIEFHRKLTFLRFLQNKPSTD